MRPPELTPPEVSLHSCRSARSCDGPSWAGGLSLTGRVGLSMARQLVSASCWFHRMSAPWSSDLDVREEPLRPSGHFLPPVRGPGRGAGHGLPRVPHRLQDARLFLNPCPHYWDSETGENDSFAGKGHTNQVSRMTVDESGQLVSCSMDDTVRYTSLSLRDYR